MLQCRLWLPVIQEYKYTGEKPNKWVKMFRENTTRKAWLIFISNSVARKRMNSNRE